MADRSTIVALATAPVPAGIAVIRISGPATKKLLGTIFNGGKDPLAVPRELVVGNIGDFSNGTDVEVVDRGMVVFFPNPHSFTGEDVAELHLHGSLALVEKILRLLVRHGAMPATPGEFTRRAFLNGKLDLVQAEAVAEMCAATSEAALRVAHDHLQGRLSQSVESVGEPLREALALVEAGIDFVDEGIELLPRADLVGRLMKVLEAVAGLLSTYHFGHVVRDGCRVLICGRPNAGKSSLLNLLLAKEQAIVSPIAGTTRDLIEAEATLGGFRFVLCDSAGITETEDPVEQIGVLKARERFKWADLVLLVVDASDVAADWRLLQHEIAAAEPAALWVVYNKVDLQPAAPVASEAKQWQVSAKTKAGIPQFLEGLVTFVAKSEVDSAAASSVVTGERHRALLLSAEESVKTALRQTEGGTVPVEIIAADIRAALRALDEIVGRTYNEDILGRIFSRFCIGK